MVRTTTRIVIADDHQLMRDLVSVLLRAQPDLEVVGEAETGVRLIELVDELRPDLVLVDIGMPDLNGTEAARRIAAKHRHVRIIALSAQCDRRAVSEMFRAGAVGYLPKTCAKEEIIEAIRAVLSGHAYISPTIAGEVVRDYLSGLAAPELSGATGLTPREREVLQLLAEGHTVKRIAGLLDLSPKTVEGHRAQVMEKLELRGMADLVKYAIREGLTSLDF